MLLTKISYNSIYYLFNNKYFLSNFIFVKDLILYLSFFNFMILLNAKSFFLFFNAYLSLAIAWGKKIRKIFYIEKFKRIRPIKLSLCHINLLELKNLNLFFKKSSFYIYNYNYFLNYSLKKNNFNVLYKNHVNVLFLFSLISLNTFPFFYFNSKFIFFFKLRLLLIMNFIFIKWNSILLKKNLNSNLNLNFDSTSTINFRFLNIFDLLIFNWNLL